MTFGEEKFVVITRAPFCLKDITLTKVNFQSSFTKMSFIYFQKSKIALDLSLEQFQQSLNRKWIIGFGGGCSGSIYSSHLHGEVEGGSYGFRDGMTIASANKRVTSLALRHATTLHGPSPFSSFGSSKIALYYCCLGLDPWKLVAQLVSPTKLQSSGINLFHQGGCLIWRKKPQYDEDEPFWEVVLIGMVMDRI